MPLPESRNPTNDNSLTGLFNEVLRDHLKITNDMLPAKVISYDRANNKATVQPLIQMLDTEGNAITRATNSNIPVLLLGAGDFFVSFHLPENSLGWIKANDRDLSLFLQGFSENPPNTLRMHTFEDALFIPDIMTGYNINADDSDSMTIQNTDATVRLSLNNNRIKITAPLLEIDTTGALKIDSASLSINTSGAVAITSGSLTHNGVNVGATHSHTQAPDSGGNTEQNTGNPQ